MAVFVNGYVTVFVYSPLCHFTYRLVYNESLSYFQSLQSPREHDGGGSQEKHGNQRRKNTCFREQVMSAVVISLERSTVNERPKACACITQMEAPAEFDQVFLPPADYLSLLALFQKSILKCI